MIRCEKGGRPRFFSRHDNVRGNGRYSQVLHTFLLFSPFSFALSLSGCLEVFPIKGANQVSAGNNDTI